MLGYVTHAEQKYNKSKWKMTEKWQNLDATQIYCLFTIHGTFPSQGRIPTIWYNEHYLKNREKNQRIDLFLGDGSCQILNKLL